MRNLLEYKDLIEREVVKKNTSVRKLAPEIGLSWGVLYGIVNGKAQNLQVRTRRTLDDYFGPEGDTDPLADIRAEVAELKRRLNGADPALHKISLTDSQRQELRKKYIHNEVVSVAGRVNGFTPDELETLDRFLCWWNKIIRKTNSTT